MRFSTEEEVKKWLRGLPLLRKELTMKSDFYQDLIRDSAKMGTVGEKHIHYYQTQIDEIHQKLKVLVSCFDSMMEYLAPEERSILTARYVNQLYWDAIEFHVHYCRRQAIRIHNNAVMRLVGIEIGGKKSNEEAKQHTIPRTGSGKTQGALALRQ